MQVVTAEFIKGKKVLLRYDIDVALRLPSVAQGYNPSDFAQGKLVVSEDFKLKAGLPTLKLCLENAAQVIIVGHLGRPEGKVVPELSVEPIKQWFSDQGFAGDLGSGKLKILENLRFDPREEISDLGFTKELAKMGEVYVNESFSAYHPGVSTTVLPILLPHAAGLRFAEEVRMLKEVRDNPKKPFIAIMGGAKVEDKLPVIKVLAERADVVLVGGKIASELTKNPTAVGKNVLIGKLREDGLDITPETVSAWEPLIRQSRMIVWNGPVGKIDNGQLTMDNLGSAKGSYEIARMILGSQATTVVGGGDTVAFLGSLGMLGEFEKRGLVSVGGGAMLKFLAEGTLPTIEALDGNP